jgi:polyferredoxin
MYSLLADVILVTHFLFVAFIVGGLALIWIGATRGWQWVHNLWFRTLHLAAISFVALEALCGVMCPLTVWEDALRGVSAGKSFVERWLHTVLFYDFPEWVFATAYVAFTVIVAATWYRVRPMRSCPPDHTTEGAPK